MGTSTLDNSSAAGARECRLEVAEQKNHIMSRYGVAFALIFLWLASMVRPVAALPSPRLIGTSCAANFSSAPNTTSDGNELLGVSATSRADAWAVGYHLQVRTDDSWPLTEHYDGTSWSIVISPQPDFSQLSSVREITPTDVWAVGSVLNRNGISQTLTMHWDGTTWTIVASPDVGSNSNQLNALAANSTSDIWAFGSYFDTTANAYLTLALHWDGASWSVVSSPDVTGSNNQLLGAGSLGSTDVWAVGVSQGSSSPKALAEVWNGSALSIVPTPNIGYSIFRSIVPIAQNNTWAFGYYYSGPYFAPLAEVWNGSAFSVSPTPTVAGQNTVINGAAAISATDVWAVGNTFLPDRTFTMNWNGSVWTVVASPNRGTTGDDLDAVARIPGSSLAWAVGRYFTRTARTSVLVLKLHC
ncbi:MAG TPA: hypothetical protein VFO25_11750 [Candidatus Eremiobacteraceae bacterium]|nr:hypothetical protein [Candidatus Eremiobacteraceae bacterium]